MVAEYREIAASSWPSEVEYYGSLGSPREAIDKAGWALTKEGKRHSHQSAYRFPDEVMRLWHSTLVSNEEEIGRCVTFGQLHDLLWALRTPGIGKLTVYDTSIRIGAKRELLPDCVYVHAGVAKGARALGFGGDTGVIQVTELPTELLELEPYEIEDFLCIYKAELAGGQPSSKVLGRAGNSKVRGC